MHRILQTNGDAYYYSKFLIYIPSISSGIAIPYPSISLHAIRNFTLPSTDQILPGLYMQIETPIIAAEEDAQDEDMDRCVTMTIVPPLEAPQQQYYDLDDEEEDLSPITKMFNAVTACQNLHPDPPEEDDSANGIGLPLMDTSSGWITADNMHEFFDEDGNPIANGSPYGNGTGNGHEMDMTSPSSTATTGTKRRRDDDDDEDYDTDEDGHCRTDWAGEESKWRRTG